MTSDVLATTENDMDMETVRDLVKKLRLIAKAFAYEKVTNAQAKSTVPHLNDAIATIEGLMQELAMLQQASLEYCEDCGWNARVPEYGCLKCMDDARPPLDRCPQCGGEADNGHDRCHPPSAYLCSKCTETPNAEVSGLSTRPPC